LLARELIFSLRRRTGGEAIPLPAAQKKKALGQRVRCSRSESIRQFDPVDPHEKLTTAFARI